MLALMNEDLSPLVIHQALGVAPARAYRAFVDEFAQWWPVLTHSLSRDPATRCRLQPVAGGVIEEISPDGSCHRWGEVLALDEGRKLRFSWHPGREASSAQWVEVRLETAGRGTLLVLTHGGWEALGEIAPILRREYRPGWEFVLSRALAVHLAPGG